MSVASGSVVKPRLTLHKLTGKCGADLIEITSKSDTPFAGEETDDKISLIYANSAGLLLKHKVLVDIEIQSRKTIEK